MLNLPITYRQWRSKMLSTIRNQRRVGLTPRRGAPSQTRGWLAYQLREIRAGRVYTFKQG